MYYSHLDNTENKQELTEDIWAVTLTRVQVHAEIIMEGVEHGKYFCKLLHLTGFGSSPQIFSGIGYASGVLPSYTSNAGVRVKDLTGHAANLKYDDKSSTWYLAKEAAQKLLVSAQSEEKDEKENRASRKFSLYGRYNLINLIKEMMGFPIADNCSSWALTKLRKSGINVEVGNESFLVCYTNRYSSSSAQLKEYSINDLCEFAKNGDVDAIRINFDNDQIDVNKLTENVGFGPVEVFLGRYNPLALAVAYNRLETVRVLIEEYGADITCKVGRRKDHTILDCANRIFWFNPEGASSELKQYLLEIAKGNEQSFSTSSNAYSYSKLVR